MTTKISPTRTLLRIESLRKLHTQYCSNQQWEKASKINDRIIQEWKRYHSQVELTGLEEVPQIGSVPFVKFMEIINHFLLKYGKVISETDARALYKQGKSALDVIENRESLL